MPDPDPEEEKQCGSGSETVQKKISVLIEMLIISSRVYVVYPDEFHNGLWGGEGVIKGMLKRQELADVKKPAFGTVRYCISVVDPVGSGIICRIWIRNY